MSLCINNLHTGAQIMFSRCCSECLLNQRNETFSHQWFLAFFNWRENSLFTTLVMHYRSQFLFAFSLPQVGCVCIYPGTKRCYMEYCQTHSILQEHSWSGMLLYFTAGCIMGTPCCILSLLMLLSRWSS